MRRSGLLRRAAVTSVALQHHECIRCPADHLIGEEDQYRQQRQHDGGDHQHFFQSLSPPLVVVKSANSVAEVVKHEGTSKKKGNPAATGLPWSSRGMAKRSGGQVVVIVPFTPLGKNPPELTPVFGVRNTIRSTCEAVRVNASPLRSVGTMLAWPSKVIF